jgi:hypothetical protein
MFINDKTEYITINPSIKKIEINEIKELTYDDYIEKCSKGLIKLSDVPKKFHNDNLIDFFISTNPYNIEFVEKPNDILCKKVLKLNAFAINRIIDPNMKKKYLNYAIKKCPQLILCIPNPSKKMFESIRDFTKINAKKLIITPNILKNFMKNSKCNIYM